MDHPMNHSTRRGGNHHPGHPMDHPMNHSTRRGGNHHPGHPMNHPMNHSTRRGGNHHPGHPMNHHKGGFASIPYPPGYSQYQNNLPLTPSYSVGGVLGAKDLGLANPPPISPLSNCTNCADNYSHYPPPNGTSFVSRGH
jgi:hypothetical protein